MRHTIGMRLQPGKPADRGWKRSFLPALLLALAFLCSGMQSVAMANGGDIVWRATDSQPGKQEAVASMTDSAGNVIITGSQNAAGSNEDIFTTKFKADGTGPAWRVLFDKAGGEDRALAVAVDTNDDVIVTGYAWNGFDRDIHTIKYNGATGAVVWQHTFNGAAGGSDIGTVVAVDSLNNVYIAGNSQSSAGNDDIIILKYPSAGPQGGAPLWQTAYAGAANGIDQVNSITSAAGGLALTGKSWNGTAYDMLTAKYDFDGAKLWEKRYSTGSGSSNGCIGNQVRIDGSGNVVAVGSVANGSNLDIYTVKYDGTTGTPIWQKGFDGGFDEEPLGVAVDAAGDVYVTGYTYTLSGANDFFTARYAAATGAVVWQRMYDSGSGNTDMAVATGIVVDPAGDAFVTGYTVTEGNYDFRTIKYKRDNGNLLWQQSHDAPAGKNDRPVGIGLSPSGDVLISGWSDTMTDDLDFVVIKYDKGLLNAATDLTASAVSATSIQLAWNDNSANEEGFKIERRLGETGTWGQIASLPANTVSFTDTGLAADNAYYYRVRSYNASNGDSHYSNEAHAITVFVSFTPPAWSFTYNNPDNTDDYANAIAVGPDNNPVVTGYSNRALGTFDYVTVKLNRVDKSVLWSDQYDDADGEVDEAKCVAVDGNNNVLVSGFSQLYYPPAERNINSIFTIKYPAAGPPDNWHGQYNGPGAIDDRATAIATTVDGADNVVVIGYGKNASDNDDIYVIKYAATPALNQQGGAIPSWAAAPFDGGGDDIPSAVAVAPDGSVYVTGISERGAQSGIYNWFTAKYNGSTGALVWSDIYSVTTGGDNRGNSIAVDADGNVYVTGSATTASLSKDIYTIKYSGSSTTPQRIWERTIDGTASGDDAAIGVRVDPIDGAIVIAGTMLTSAGDHDITVARYTPGGDKLWGRTLLRQGQDDTATAMTMDSSGYVYVGGNAVVGTDSDIISLIYDSEGNLLGATSYTGTDLDEASSIAVNNKGEAFIAGYSKNTNNADYVVLKQVNNFILVPAPFAAVSQADSTKISLSWGNNTPGTSFLLERTPGPVTGLSNWTQIVAPAAGTTSFQDSGLADNSSYCYRITAVSGSFSSRKLIACAKTTPVAPTLNAVSLVSPTAIDLSWNNVAGNTGYKVERSTNNSTWIQAGGDLPANATAYHDTGLTAGTVYFYRVAALSNSGDSLSSKVQAAPVLNALAGITASRIDLSWPAVAGATGYKLERGTDGSTWAQTAAPAAAATAYSDTAVASGILYYYRLKAVTSSGDSAASLPQSGRTKLQTPMFSSASATSVAAISLAWTDPNSNETGSTLEYSQCTYSNPTSCASAVGNDYYWGAWTSVSLPADTVSTSVGSLASGRTYRFRVTANLAGADSDRSNVVLATTNLTGPANLTATAATGSSATLSWSDGIGETNYRVEQNGTLLDGVTLAGNSSTYTVQGLSPNTQYCFRVQPYNSGSSAYSNQACVTLYAAPTLTSAVPSSTTNKVTLTWADVPGGIGYEVWRSSAAYQPSPPADPTTGSWMTYTNLTSTLLPAGTTTYDSTGLSYGYTYKYKIRYKLPDGSFSPYGNEIMAVTLPPVPTGANSSGVTTTQMNFYWSDGYGEQNYNYQLKQRAGANCTTEDWTGVAAVTVGANTTSYPATALVAGTTYCFRLNASNNAGASAWSSAITQTTLLPAPVLNAPTGVTQSSISLSWGNVTGNYGYKVERSTDNVSWSTINSPAANVVSYTDSGLVPNQIYYYRVSTKNSANAFSVASATQSATTLPVTPPVLNPLSGITISQIVLTWSDVSGNAGYKVEQSTDNVNWIVAATPAAGATSYTSTGLQAGTLYFYRISTKNSVGAYSAASNVRSATTTPPAPAAPGLNGVSEARIDLSWQLVPGATNYKIMRSVGTDGPWTLVADSAVPYATRYCGIYSTPSIDCPTLVPAFTSAQDTGLTQGTTYCYRLNAWNATGGDSAAGAVSCLKTAAVGGPVLTAVTPLNSMKISLNWSYDPASCSPVACGAPDGFEVWRQLPNGEWAQMAAVAVSTYADTISIEPATPYSYRIRAYKGADRSPFSNVMTATTPGYGVNDTTCPQ